TAVQDQGLAPRLGAQALQLADHLRLDLLDLDFHVCHLSNLEPHQQTGADNRLPAFSGWGRAFIPFTRHYSRESPDLTPRPAFFEKVDSSDLSSLSPVKNEAPTPYC